MAGSSQGRRWRDAFSHGGAQKVGNRLMATLKQFLTTGQLGDIALGISQGEVLRLLGEPEAKGGDGKAVIWKYGPLQVTFNKAADCTAIGMIVLCTGNGAMPKSIHLEGWVPGPNTNFEDFKHF